MLERVDLDATRFDRGGARVRRPRREAADDVTRPRSRTRCSSRRRTGHGPTITRRSTRSRTREALDRVIEKLREQGLEPQPIAGRRGRAAADGRASRSSAATRSCGAARRRGARRPRCCASGSTASGDGPRRPSSSGDLVAARAAPDACSAPWLDREELAPRARDRRPGSALRGAEARVRLDEDAARADARVDFEGLPDERAAAAGGRARSRCPPARAIASASADQSRTTVFLARLARELYPESRFVRRVEALERQEGVRFEDEVLRQFAGPSFTRAAAGRGDGDVAFGARSTLRDPAAMRAQLDAARAGAAGHPRGPAGARLDRPDRPAVHRARRAADAGGVRAAGRGRRQPARRRRRRAALRGDRARRGGLPAGPEPRRLRA